MVCAPLPRVAAVIWSRPLMVLAVTAATPTELLPGLVFWTLRRAAANSRRRELARALIETARPT